MPGHAGKNRALPWSWQDILKLDITEVEGLDDLHWPRGPIEAGQQLMAQAFGAGKSCFLVNGASSGIQSFFMGLKPGSRVLVPRNAHRSFFAGMVLSGVFPMYIPCQISDTGLALAVEQQDIEGLLGFRPEAAAVVSPSYYGTTCHIDSIAQLLHDRNIPLMVDEAHGGHFYFHPAYPPTALAAGADVVVNGLHKTLPVLTQGACLHIGASCGQAERFVKAVSLLTTTSPSYLIMASIDLAREWMERYGRAALERALLLSCTYRDKINDIEGFGCTVHELMITGVQAIDPLKILLSVRELAADGYTVSRMLRQESNIEVEWESGDNILAMMSIFHDHKDWEQLYRALRNISKQIGTKKSRDAGKPPPLPTPQVQISPREAFFAEKTSIPLESSIGKICGDMIVPYPPGIPCLLPGEKITAEICTYIEELIRAGHHIQGWDDSMQQMNIIDGS